MRTKNPRLPTFSAFCGATLCPCRRAILALFFLGTSSLYAVAPEDRNETTPTGWYWYHGASASFITQQIVEKGLRIVDLEVESGSPLRFTVAFARNTGVYAKSWWWYYGLTAQQVAERIEAHGGRIIDLNPYDVGGSTRFAIVMVSNTGTDAKSWAWYYCMTPQSIWDRHQENGARLVDLDRYEVGGSVRWSCVMVRNSGSDASGWWWYHGITAAQVTEHLESKNARIVDLERYVVNGQQRFSVILLPNTGATAIRWWWYYGVSASQLLNLNSQNGARVVDVEPYTVNGSKRFAALIVSNANAVTERLAELLGYGSDGATGLYLKRVDGPVLASLQPDFVFEPASTIKALAHLYAMVEVQENDATLGELINYCSTMNGSCPVNPPCDQADRSLQWLLQQMMWFSDNPATDSVIRRFGRAALNDFADDLGMSATQINHTLGCGGPLLNELTLRDIGRLYEEVASGILQEDLRNTFYALMSGKHSSYADGTVDFTGAWGSIVQIIDQEAAALGVSSAERDAFKRQIRFANKAGGYGIGGLSYVSQAGWISLPVCQNGRAAAREYVFSFFMHGARDQTYVDSRFRTLRGEILREQIRDALGDFTSSCGEGAHESFRRGDANQDGGVDISDSVEILRVLFRGSRRLLCEDAADLNDDGRMDISDAVAGLNFLFGGGTHIPSPGPDRCGGDPTMDALSCSTSSALPCH